MRHGTSCAIFRGLATPLFWTLDPWLFKQHNHGIAVSRISSQIISFAISVS
jgi:hypothetical protein